VNPRPADSRATESVRVSEVLGALSMALDLTEGQPPGHSLRSCLIGLRLGEVAGLSLHDRRDLYFALLLKDVGCSGDSARLFQLFGGDEHATHSALKRVDWSSYLRAARMAMTYSPDGGSWLSRARRIAWLSQAGSRVAAEMVEARAQRATGIIQRLGFGPAVAGAVASIDEHWDGRGQPRGLHGHEIPIAARILSLSQSVEVHLAAGGTRAALEAARERAGGRFDPSLARAVPDLRDDLEAWRALDEAGLHAAVRAREPGDAALLAGPGALDRLALAFADVVDAKSPFTAVHSRRVGDFAVAIGDQLGLGDLAVADLRRAALLHDIGKLAVPNAILDKPGPLSAKEWEVMREHPFHTLRVLLHVRAFKEMAHVAASHHERLDGDGYFRRLRGPQFPLEGQILATADMFEALTAARPYRPALPEEVALRILERDRGRSVGGECLDALSAVVEADLWPSQRAA
jgi:HD-GYP domain-containing protein (c-di-GMP phosphodiesterase class II)